MYISLMFKLFLQQTQNNQIVMIMDKFFYLSSNLTPRFNHEDQIQFNKLYKAALEGYVDFQRSSWIKKHKQDVRYKILQSFVTYSKLIKDLKDKVAYNEKTNIQKNSNHQMQQTLLQKFQFIMHYLGAIDSDNFYGADKLIKDEKYKSCIKHIQQIFCRLSLRFSKYQQVLNQTNQLKKYKQKVNCYQQILNSMNSSSYLKSKKNYWDPVLLENQKQDIEQLCQTLKKHQQKIRIIARYQSGIQKIIQNLKSKVFCVKIFDQLSKISIKLEPLDNQIQQKECIQQINTLASVIHQNRQIYFVKQLQKSSSSRSKSVSISTSTKQKQQLTLYILKYFYSVLSTSNSEERVIKYQLFKSYIEKDSIRNEQILKYCLSLKNYFQKLKKFDQFLEQIQKPKTQTYDNFVEINKNIKNYPYQMIPKLNKQYQRYLIQKTLKEQIQITKNNQQRSILSKIPKQILNLLPDGMGNSIALIHKRDQKYIYLLKQSQFKIEEIQQIICKKSFKRSNKVGSSTLTEDINRCIDNIYMQLIEDRKIQNIKQKRSEKQYSTVVNQEIFIKQQRNRKQKQQQNQLLQKQKTLDEQIERIRQIQKQVVNLMNSFINEFQKISKKHRNVETSYGIRGGYVNNGVKAFYHYVVYELQLNEFIKKQAQIIQSIFNKPPQSFYNNKKQISKDQYKTRLITQKDLALKYIKSDYSNLKNSRQPLSNNSSRQTFQTKQTHTNQSQRVNTNLVGFHNQENKYALQENKYLSLQNKCKLLQNQITVLNNIKRDYQQNMSQQDSINAVNKQIIQQNNVNIQNLKEKLVRQKQQKQKIENNLKIKQEEVTLWFNKYFDSNNLRQCKQEKVKQYQIAISQLTIQLKKQQNQLNQILDQQKSIVSQKNRQLQLTKNSLALQIQQNNQLKQNASKSLQNIKTLQNNIHHFIKQNQNLKNQIQIKSIQLEQTETRAYKLDLLNNKAQFKIRQHQKIIKQLTESQNQLRTKSIESQNQHKIKLTETQTKTQQLLKKIAQLNEQKQSCQGQKQFNKTELQRLKTLQNEYLKRKKQYKSFSINNNKQDKNNSNKNIKKNLNIFKIQSITITASQKIIKKNFINQQKQINIQGCGQQNNKQLIELKYKQKGIIKQGMKQIQSLRKRSSSFQLLRKEDYSYLIQQIQNKKQKKQVCFEQQTKNKQETQNSNIQASLKQQCKINKQFESLIQQLKKNILQYQEQIKNITIIKNAEYLSLQIKYNQLLEQKQKETQQIQKLIKQNEIQKISSSEFRQKYLSQKQQFWSQKLQLQKQVNVFKQLSLLKQKQTQSNSKYIQQINHLTSKNQQLSTQLQKLQYQIKQYKDKLGKHSLNLQNMQQRSSLQKKNNDIEKQYQLRILNIQAKFNKKILNLENQKIQQISQIKQYMQKINALNQTIQKKQTNSSLLQKQQQSKINILNNQIQNLKQQIQIIKKQLSNQKNKNNQPKLYQSAIQQLNQLIQITKKESLQWKIKFTEVDVNFSQFKDTHQQLREQYKTLKNKFQEIQTKSKKFSYQKDTEIEQINKINNQKLNKLLHQITQKDKQILNIKDTLDKKQEQIKKAKKQYQTCQNKYKQQLQNIEQNGLKALSDLRDLQTSMQDMKYQKSKLQNKQQKYKQRQKQLEQKLRIESEKRVNLNKQIQAVKRQKSNMQLAIKTGRYEKSERSNESYQNISNNRLEMDKLRKQFQSQQTKYKSQTKSYETKLKLLQEESTKLKQQSTQWKKKYKQLSTYQPQSQCLIFDRFFPGLIMQNLYDKKYELYNLIKQQTKRQVKTTRLIYRYDLINPNSFHVYVDGIQNILLIVKTKGKKSNIFGSFSTAKIQKDTIEKDNHKSFIFTFNPQIQDTITHYPINYKNDNCRSLSYDDYFLIVGNSEIRLRFGQTIVYSNFGINNGFYQAKGDPVEALLMAGDSRQVEIEGYQCFQVVFK